MRGSAAAYPTNTCSCSRRAGPCANSGRIWRPADPETDPEDGEARDSGRLPQRALRDLFVLALRHGLPEATMQAGSRRARARHDLSSVFRESSTARCLQAHAISPPDHRCAIISQRCDSPRPARPRRAAGNGDRCQPLQPSSTPARPVRTRRAATPAGPTIEFSAVRFNGALKCAVERRHLPAGANPARQLSLQPVAIGAVEGGNDFD